MKLGLAMTLVAACGGAAPPAPVAAARAPMAVAAPPPAATVEVARDYPPNVRYPQTGIRYWAARLDESGHAQPMTPDFRAGMAVTQADVECRIERVGTPAATCSARPPATETTDAEAWFRERFAACFRVAHVAPAPATLRALEAALVSRLAVPLLPTRPAMTTSFLTVSVHVHENEMIPMAPLVSECEGVPHPCDPVRLRRRLEPGKTLTRAVERRSFAAFGPREYVFYGGMSSANLFPESGAPAVYALVDLADRRGTYTLDPRFALSEADPRATYDRLAPLATGDEKEPVRLALAIDRAVLAYKLGDDAAGKKWARELDALLAGPHAEVAEYARAPLEATRATFAAIDRGDFTTHDPCAR